MPYPNQIEKEIDHMFFNLLELNPEDEEGLIFMSVLSVIASKYGTCTIDLFPYEDFRSKGLNLPIRLAVNVKSFQFYLKYLQEKGCCQSMVVSTTRP